MSERMFLAMIERSCQKNGIDLSVLSDGWLIGLRKADMTRRITGLSFDLNSQATAAAATDKAATSALLDAKEVPRVRHVLLNPNHSEPNTDMINAMLKDGHIVLKPLEGGKGELVTMVKTLAEATELMQAYPLVTWAASPWYDIAFEVRVVIVDGEVRLAYKKIEPVVIDGLKFFNLSKGAKAKTMEHDAELWRLAERTVEALGLRMAAVDIICTTDGHMYVLEVNASFSLTRYAATNNATYEEVALFYDRIVADMFTT